MYLNMYNHYKLYKKLPFHIILLLKDSFTYSIIVMNHLLQILWVEKRKNNNNSLNIFHAKMKL
jgi:hypothetical protein